MDATVEVRELVEWARTLGRMTTMDKAVSASIYAALRSLGVEPDAL